MYIVEVEVRWTKTEYRAKGWFVWLDKAGLAVGTERENRLSPEVDCGTDQGGAKKGGSFKH